MSGTCYQRRFKKKKKKKKKKNTHTHTHSNCISIVEGPRGNRFEVLQEPYVWWKGSTLVSILSYILKSGVFF